MLKFEKHACDVYRKHGCKTQWNTFHTNTPNLFFTAKSKQPLVNDSEVHGSSSFGPDPRYLFVLQYVRLSYEHGCRSFFVASLASAAHVHTSYNSPRLVGDNLEVEDEFYTLGRHVPSLTQE